MGFATPQHTPMGRGFLTSLGYIAGAYNGYLHAWSANGARDGGTTAAPCSAYPGQVKYKSDANGTIPGPHDGARCTAASVKARARERCARTQNAPPIFRCVACSCRVFDE